MASVTRLVLVLEDLHLVAGDLPQHLGCHLGLGQDGTVAHGVAVIVDDEQRGELQLLGVALDTPDPEHVARLDLRLLVAVADDLVPGENLWHRGTTILYRHHLAVGTRLSSLPGASPRPRPRRRPDRPGRSSVGTTRR